MGGWVVKWRGYWVGGLNELAIGLSRMGGWVGGGVYHEKVECDLLILQRVEVMGRRAREGGVGGCMGREVLPIIIHPPSKA